MSNCKNKSKENKMNYLNQVAPSTGCFWGTNVLSAIENAEKMGFKTLELNCGRDYDERGAAGVWPWENDMKEKIREKVASFERLGMHSTFLDILPLSPNPGIRRESLRQLLLSIEFTADLGGKYLVVHPGWNTCSLDDEMVRKMCLENLKELVDAASKRGVAIAVENVEYFRAYPLNDVLAIIKEIDSPYLGMTLDVPRALPPMENGELTFKQYGDIPNFIREAGDLLFNVHLHGWNDEKAHIPITERDLPFYSGIMKALKDIDYKNSLILEVITTDYNDFLSSREMLGKALESN
jgi:sugar phosphate isomerase/epimerase